MNCTTLREAVRVRLNEWYGEDYQFELTPSYFGNELAGEVGEACNVIKKLERERFLLKGSRDTVEHLEEELGDVIICAYQVAAQYDIDLEQTIKDKFNDFSIKLGLKTRYV